MFVNGANGLKSRGIEKAGIYGGGSNSGGSGNTGGNSGTTDDGYPICSSASVSRTVTVGAKENNTSCKVR